MVAFNDAALLSLRQQAVEIFQAGVAAADPFQAVKRYLTTADGKLQILSNNPAANRTGLWSKIHVIAFGKAACPMIQAALTVIPPALLGTALAVTNYENATTIAGIEVIGAAHPYPDETGFYAARRCAELAQSAQKGELVLVLVSGGGSALLPYPVDSVSLADKIRVTQLLLASGATINEINCIRKHLSQLKGGGLARMIAPAECHALILSDVLGDELSAIASGPTVPDETTFADAVGLLQSKAIWDDLPLSVRDYFAQGLSGKVTETPKKYDLCFTLGGHTLIGSNAISLAAISQAAEQRGFMPITYSTNLSGEARQVAADLVLFAKNSTLTNKPPCAILAGGETTVTLQGKGKGGRNQEMALAFAINAEQQKLTGNWMFLSGGTDGRDGPTDAAGGVVDANTISRLLAASCNPSDKLANNDAYTALKTSGDLLMTGATGTNVADLQLLLIQN